MILDIFSKKGDQGDRLLYSNTREDPSILKVGLSNLTPNPSP